MTLTMTKPQTDEIRDAAKGRWRELFRMLLPELSEALESRRHILCPLPGHDDSTPSFRIDKPEEGRAICTCGSYDGFDLLMQLRGWDFPEAKRQVAAALGVNGHTNGKPTRAIDLIEQVERAKGIPLGMLANYGASITSGKFNEVVRVPMYGPDLEQCSHFDLDAKNKGFMAAGKPAGVFLPHDEHGKPIMPSGTVAIVEGPKDSPALFSLGYFAVGLPTSHMNAKFAPLFTGCDVVVVHDLDAAGIEGATKTAGRLLGIASSVRIARLPGEIKESGGDDVRDILRKPDGEQLVRQAIEQATPHAVHSPECSISNVEIEITEDDEGKQSQVAIPLPVNEIIARIKARTSDWPRCVGEVAFVDDDHRICWLQKAAAFFGWLGAHIGESIDWRKGTGCATKEEVFAELRRTATRYEAVEAIPHEPRLEGHYYACDFPESGDGSALAELVDRFNPATDIDRDLIMAEIVTPFWGGGPGERPLFVNTSDDGRGVGKTTLAEMAGMLAGGLMTFEPSEKSAAISTRLLTPSALTKRVALIDNVKSLKFSWADLESRITSPVINGHQMYTGDGERPNTLTWIATLNGASLSTDIAQRAVLIKLKRPKHSATWEEDTRQLINAKRQQIIGDILTFLRSERYDLQRYSRWGSWERDVLSRLPEPGEAQRVIAERQKAADVEDEESELIEDFIAERLKRLRYHDHESVLIPSGVIRQWYADATGERGTTTTKVSRHIGQLCDEGKFQTLRRNTCKKYGRGFVWGADGGICLDVEERLRNQFYSNQE